MRVVWCRHADGGEARQRTKQWSDGGVGAHVHNVRRDAVLAVWGACCECAMPCQIVGVNEAIEIVHCLPADGCCFCRAGTAPAMCPVCTATMRPCGSGFPSPQRAPSRQPAIFTRALAWASACCCLVDTTAHDGQTTVSRLRGGCVRVCDGH